MKPRKQHAELLEMYKQELQAAAGPFFHSWQKLKNESLPEIDAKNLDRLEPWEALTARFARLTDIFISKYLRFKVLDADAGFRGETRDLLDRAEKLSLISNADQWMKVRELRNKISHEYAKEDLINTFKDILQLAAFLEQELGSIKP